MSRQWSITEPKATGSWQPIDRIRQSYYRSKESPEMKDALQGCATLAALKRHHWICLFLAFFLLYNPFHTALCGSGSLDVCHRASNRATVGASELQHFTPTTGWDSLPTVDLGEGEVPAFRPVVMAETPVAERPLAIPAPQFFGSGLWFRPPPAR